MKRSPNTTNLHKYNLHLISYGQNAEDIVLMRAFSGQRNGFYVDVGAGDPLYGSITKNLYEKLGWTGINIEPNPKVYKKLVKGRPKDSNVACGVSDNMESLKFTVLKDDWAWGLSTFDQELAKGYKEKGLETESITVPMRTLNDILSEYQPRQIDLLKVDVEGWEDKVMKSIDLSKWRPKVILIEATIPTTTKQSHNKWEYLLIKAGYIQTLFDGLNRFYCLKTDKKLISNLSTPANTFDRFIPYKWWALLDKENQDSLKA